MDFLEWCEIEFLFSLMQDEGLTTVELLLSESGDYEDILLFTWNLPFWLLLSGVWCIILFYLIWVVKSFTFCLLSNSLCCLYNSFAYNTWQRFSSYLFFSSKSANSSFFSNIIVFSSTYFSRLFNINSLLSIFNCSNFKAFSIA